jgi:mRNA interferase MazF
MTPKVGEVYLLDLDYQGKVRPVVIMSREDPDAPRALALYVPLTKESRPSR